MLNRLKPKSEFSRNVLTLMTGTTIAQAIPIAISPILTRLYTPEDFGVFALYFSIASLFGMIATGRYELAIMLPKKDEDALYIVFFSIAITFMISFFLFCIIFLFNREITNLLGTPEISYWLYFIPLSVFLIGIYNCLSYWFNRQKRFNEVAINKVVQSSTMSIINFGFGAIQFGSAGLILGRIIGQTISIVIFVKNFIKDSDRKLFDMKKSLGYRIKILALIKKYRKLPIYNLPNALIDGFRTTGINWLLAKFYSTEILGQFSLAFRMIQFPIALIGNSLSQVFFQKISSISKRELYPIVINFIIKAAFVAFPFFLFIFLFAPDLFVFIFGKNWKEAGNAASTMAPWLYLNFITSPLSMIFIVLNKQDILLIFAIVYMASPLSIIFFFHHLDIIELLSIITFIMSLLLILFIILVLHFLK